ncbi:C-signal [Palaemon carinicauda]|uniref:C-signal n=1 Tax=Palaemon carinicauda TaxID=392227 RepID=UPI0035B598BC
MLARSVLITGSNRGLGLELVKQLSAHEFPPEVIIATCRTPDKAEELRKISTEHQNVHITQLDVRDESSYGGLVNHVQELVGSKGLNLLINNAGYSPKSTRINMVKWQQMSDTLLVNTIAPVMLTKALLPLLSTAASDSTLDTFCVKRAAIINMSSILGSIGANEQGGLYPYRASKAALNAITKSLSLDLRNKNILVTSIHPGWVQTDMGGKNAPLTPEVSISKMVKTFYALNEEHNGGFYQYDGEVLQW